MARSIQEIRIAKGDVRGAGAHLAADVLENDVFGDDEESAVINRRNRTMSAQVQTAPTRLDIANRAAAALVLDPRILVELRQRITHRQRETQPLQVGLR